MEPFESVHFKFLKLKANGYYEMPLDKEAAHYQPWKDANFTQCRKFFTSFAVEGKISNYCAHGLLNLVYSFNFVITGSTPFIFLATIPGSGNTWSRYLIEGLTGIFTGDVYHVKKVTGLGFMIITPTPFTGCEVIQSFLWNQSFSS